MAKLPYNTVGIGPRLWTFRFSPGLRDLSFLHCVLTDSKGPSTLLLNGDRRLSAMIRRQRREVDPSRVKIQIRGSMTTTPYMPSRRVQMAANQSTRHHIAKYLNLNIAAQTSYTYWKKLIAFGSAAREPRNTRGQVSISTTDFITACNRTTSAGRISPYFIIYRRNFKAVSN